MIKNLIFTIIYLFHVLIWSFVLVSSFFKSTVKVNIYLIIPFIYLVQILPFHILEKIKLNLMDNNEINKKIKQDNIDYVLIFPHFFSKLGKYLEKTCTFNPFSPQGMLIFGLIVGLYNAYPVKLKSLI